jgi:hypothetical protein
LGFFFVTDALSDAVYEVYRFVNLPMKTIALSLFFLGAVASMAAVREPILPFERQPETAPSSGHIDGLVFGKLTKLGIQPTNPCSDAVFVRRVYLDVIGTLPTAEETVQFLEDTSPVKRAALVDRLLERDEFADYWGMKWCDLLRVKAEFPVNLWPKAAMVYDRWIRDSIRKNTPYSQFARELLTASGSNFRDPAVNFCRSAGSHDPKALAKAVAQTFMGERTENWPPKKLTDMAAFFSKIAFKSTGEWKEEVVLFNGFDHATSTGTTATLPDGTTVQLGADKDPRVVFTDWLVSSKNSPFASNAVNRVWYWLMGRGIIQEPDDSRPDNPPSNPELLAWLARELVSSNYDMKHIFRLILNSDAYQLSCIPAVNDPRDETNFAFHPLRRMEAEVLIDAINQITGGKEDYSSITPEPYTFIPDNTRAIDLPDGSINSSFLELFGRPPRDTGLLSERNDRPTAAQRLHLLNSDHIRTKIMQSGKLRAVFRSNPLPLATATQLYLTILSRYPTQEELQALHTYSQTSEAKGGQVWFDLVWALMNSSEFLYRH